MCCPPWVSGADCSLFMQELKRPAVHRQDDRYALRSRGVSSRLPLHLRGTGAYGGRSGRWTGASPSGRRVGGADIPSGASIMSSRVSLQAEMAQIAAVVGSVEHRADALLRCLRGVIPYTAGWIAVRDPETRTHRRVGSDGDVDALARTSHSRRPTTSWRPWD